MGLKLLIFALAIFLGGCTFSPSEDALSVKEVNEKIQSLDGKSVAVIGWLGECGGNDCGLYESLDDAKLVAEGAHQSEEWQAVMERRLSIGLDEGFDFMAQFFDYEQVIIFGQVNADCSREGMSCFDRVGDVQPSSIKIIL